MAPVRVLLVDDSEDIRLLYRLVIDAHPELSYWGEAANGVEAIDLVRGEQPDAIVLDLMMPVMDGLEALPILRRLAPAVPVVVLTAVATDEVRAQVLEAGATAMLSKESDLDELTELLVEVGGQGHRGDLGARAS